MFCVKRNLKKCLKIQCAESSIEIGHSSVTKTLKLQLGNVNFITKLNLDTLDHGCSCWETEIQNINPLIYSVLGMERTLT